MTRKERTMEVKDKKYTPYATAVLATIMQIYRTVLAYINHRLRKIKALVWKMGGTVSENDQQFLSDNEKAFYLEYKKIVFDYQNSFPIDLDFYKDLDPPKDLNIEIRVLEDCGEIVTSGGDILVLERGMSMLVRRSDVEHLLRQNLIIQTK